MLVFWGFLIFTLLDGIAGSVHIAGLVGEISMWWVELALTPFALVSFFILRWCYRRWGDHDCEEVVAEEAQISGEEAGTS